jgi:hypothetical protein
VAGFRTRSHGSFNRQLKDEGLEQAVYHPTATLPPFQGNLLDYHTRLLVESRCRRDSFKKEDAEWIDKYFDPFNALAADSEQFRFALEAAVDWRYSKDARAAIARLWAGLEAIFGINSELVYRMALSMASLLEPRGTTRKVKFEKIKQLYNVRSKAVHGEPIGKEALLQCMDESYCLLRDLLVHIASRGRFLSKAELDNAIFC